MKILQVCHKPPQPAVDGGCIAINNITKGFINNKIDVKLITISTSKHPLIKEQIDKDFYTKTKLESVYVDTEINIIDALSSLITSDSYNVSRFFSPDFDKLIIETLKKEKFDIIHLESLFMTPYISTIKRFSKAKIVLRSHNLEYMIWERLASSTNNKAKKVYLKILAKQLKNYEIDVINKVDGIASITDEDGIKYKNLGCNKPVITIPFGIEVDKFEYKDITTKDNISLFHLGSMGWKPNLEAIAWFGESVFPKINDVYPNIKLHIAGRDMPNWLLNQKNKNIINHGEVNNAKEFMNNYGIMVVPLLSAGGMRIKIIEGMALGKVIISTKIGAEGIDYTDRENILIANKKSEFIKQLNWIFKDINRIKTIGKNARLLVEKKYNNKTINSKLINFYKSL